MGDFVAGVLNFEGKFWKTLPMLVWRPGELTRRYIVGERATFISPIALYLFSVFLTFAVLNFTGALDTGKVDDVGANIQFVVKEQQAEIAKLEKQRAEAVKAGKPVTNLDKKLTQDKKDLAALEKVRHGQLTDADVGDETPQWIRGVVEKVQKNPQLVVTNMGNAELLTDRPYELGLTFTLRTQAVIHRRRLDAILPGCRGQQQQCQAVRASGYGNAEFRLLADERLQVRLETGDEVRTGDERVGHAPTLSRSAAFCRSAGPWQQPLQVGAHGYNKCC